MAQNKGEAPPPAYGAGIASPAPAHVGPQSQQGSDYYGASSHASPHPNAISPYQNPGPPQNYPPQNYQQDGNNGYYAPGPQMGYPQGGGFQQQNGNKYYQQGPPQGYQQNGPNGYYPPGPPMGYQQGPYYGQQQNGYYRDDRGGTGSGIMGGLLGALACCCCLDCLLF